MYSAISLKRKANLFFALFHRSWTPKVLDLGGTPKNSMQSANIIVVDEETAALYPNFDEQVMYNRSIVFA
jgi:hypothetical protein